MDNLRDETNALNVVQAQSSKLAQRYQALLDQSTPYTLYRWVSFAIALILFGLRIVIAQGWYIIAYALGIYLLNLFLAFLSPKFDPSIDQELADQDAEEGQLHLPTSVDDEFKPFIRRLPEFKFWHSALRATIIAFIASWFSIFDVPVFWPILIVYWFILFVVTMKRQIQHMIRYRYIPFDLGKKSWKR